MIDRDQIRNRLAVSVGGEGRLAQNFSARTMSDLNKRAARELDEAADSIVGTLERIDMALLKANFAEYGEEDREQFIARFVRMWAAYQGAGARTLNWMVTGPARFPVRSNEKRMNTEHKRLTELIEFEKAAPSRAVAAAKRDRNRALGADGMASEELADLKAHLANREAAQQRMKITNEIIRRGKMGPGDSEKLKAALAERGYEINVNLAGMILRPDYGRPGYATFQLTNNNATINRLRVRVVEVEKKLERIEGGGADEQEINGIRIVEDAADDRLRLIFGGKPQPEMIKSLKSRGFRWSPTNMAWQRQLTDNARYAAAWIAKQGVVAEPTQ